MEDVEYIFKGNDVIRAFYYLNRNTFFTISVNLSRYTYYIYIRDMKQM